MTGFDAPCAIMSLRVCAFGLSLQDTRWPIYHLKLNWWHSRKSGTVPLKPISRRATLLHPSMSSIYSSCDQPVARILSSPVLRDFKFDSIFIWVFIYFIFASSTTISLHSLSNLIFHPFWHIWSRHPYQCKQGCSIRLFQCFLFQILHLL